MKSVTANSTAASLEGWKIKFQNISESSLNNCWGYSLTGTYCHRSHYFKWNKNNYHSQVTNKFISRTYSAVLTHSPLSISTYHLISHQIIILYFSQENDWFERSTSINLFRAVYTCDLWYYSTCKSISILNMKRFSASTLFVLRNYGRLHNTVQLAPQQFTYFFIELLFKRRDFINFRIICSWINIYNKTTRDILTLHWRAFSEKEKSRLFDD